MFNWIKRIFKKDVGVGISLSSVNEILPGMAGKDGSYINQYSRSIYVFASVNKIAQKVSTLDLRLYQIINSKGESKEILNHPLLDLLYKPNAFQTRSEFLKITEINKKLCGEAFWVKVRNNSGRVMELWNLRPDFVTVITDPDLYIKQYEFQPQNGTRQVFDPSEIIHIKDPNPTEPHRGLSPISAAKMRIDTEHFATQFQREFFMNYSRPDALILSPDKIGDDEKIAARAAWEQRHKGANKSGKINFLEGGMTYQQVSISQREMDYIESLKFTRDDILVAFGVPKSVVTTDDVNLANANTGMAVFLQETIKPEMQMIVETLNEMLVGPDFGLNLYLDFVDPTPDNREQRLNEFDKGVDRWITPNEIRNELNLPPLAGGDSLLRGALVAPIATSATPTKALDQSKNVQKIFRGRPVLRAMLEMQENFVDGVGKALASKSKPKKTKQPKKAKQEKRHFISLIKSEMRSKYFTLMNSIIDKRASKFQKALEAESVKQKNRVLKNLKKVAKSLKKKAVDIEDVFDEVKENKIYAKFSFPYFEEILVAAGQDALDLLGTGDTFKVDANIERFLKERSQFFAESVNNTTLEKLSKTLAEGINAGEGINDLSDRVSAVYEEFPTYRADTIARTETTASNNEGLLNGYKQSGVVEGKEWVATLDDRTRDSHAEINGEIVGKDEQFSNGLDYPGDESGDAGEVINCRCVLAPAVVQ